MRQFIYILLLVFLFSCAEKEPVIDENLKEVFITNYAKGFQVLENDSSFIYVSLNPTSGEELSRLAITKSERKNPDFLAKLLPLSATHIAYIAKLGLIDRIKGITYAPGIANKKIQTKLKNGTIHDIGNEGSPNQELVISINPDLVFSFPFATSDSWIHQLGYSSFPVTEYLEIHPLGQAEWIRFFGHLLNREAIADSVFNSIKTSYINYTKQSSEKKITVLTGELFDNMWTLPGGKSATAQLIKDAGGYLESFGDTSSGSRKVDYERILQEQDSFDKWIFMTYSPEKLSKSYLLKKNPKYKFLSILKTDYVFTCNSAKSSYFEDGILEPHLILLDLIHIFSDSAGDNKYFKQLQ